MFRVLTANYSAEYGSSAAAVINLAVKGGTTDFRSIAYEFFRNDAIQARAFNALTIPELRFNNFGWNLGGLIYIPRLFNKDKSKLFFFIGEDFKRLRLRSNQHLDCSRRGAKKRKFLRPARGAVAQRFGHWASFSQRHRSEHPLEPEFRSPAKTSFLFTTSATTTTSTQNLTQLITYNRNIPGTNASIQWTNVPNPTTVNVAQFTFTGNVIFEKTGIAANPLFITDFTRAGEGVTYPTIYNASNAVPTIQLSGLTSLTSTPLNFNRIFDWKDDFSKIPGNHDLKLGIDYAQPQESGQCPGH